MPTISRNIKRIWRTLSGCVSFFQSFFLCKFSCNKCSCVSHMDAKEEEQGFTELVTCSYSSHTIMQLLIAKTPLHNRSAKIADYPPGCMKVGIFIFRLRPFTRKTCNICFAVFFLQVLCKSLKVA